MNRQAKSMNKVSNTTGTTLLSPRNRRRESMLFTRAAVDAMVEKTTTEETGQGGGNGWKFSTTNPSSDKRPGKKDDLAGTDQKTSKHHSIVEDLESLATGHQETESTPHHSPEQETQTECPFGRVSLRPTQGGTAMKQGEDIKSRRATRHLELRHRTHLAELGPTSDTTQVRLTVDKGETQQKTSKVSVQNKFVGRPSLTRRQRRSSIHSATIVGSPKPATSPRSRRRASLGNQPEFTGPTRIPSYLLRPVGPGKALREGTEKQTKNLRLLELSELLVDVEQLPYASSGLTHLPVQRPTTSPVQPKKGGENDQESSDPTDISSDNDSSVSSSDSSSEQEKHETQRGNTVGHSLRPNCIPTTLSDQDENDLHQKRDVHGDFTRCSPQRKKSFEGHVHPPPSLVDLSSSVQYDSDNSANVRSVNMTPEAPFSPTRTRRGGRRPASTVSLDKDEQERKTSKSKQKRRKSSRKHKSTLKPPGETSSEDEEEGTKKHAKSKRKGRKSSRSKKKTLKPPGETSGEEDSNEKNQTKQKRSRRKGHRSTRRGSTSLKAPGETSSEEEDTTESQNLRDSLFYVPKSFRRHTLVYALPKKAKDIIRKVSRKRSVRPVLKFLKILPHMLPSVKGLLQPARVVPTESEMSAATMVTSNVSTGSGAKNDMKSVATRLQEPVQHRRKSTWIPPAPTAPPPSPRKDQVFLDTIPEKPVWIEPHLRHTGQGEKIQTNVDLASPITFPIKEESSGPAFGRDVLKTTEYGETIQNGGEVLSRRARRRQDLLKRFERNTMKLTLHQDT